MSWIPAGWRTSQFLAACDNLEVLGKRTMRRQISLLLLAGMMGALAPGASRAQSRTDLLNRGLRALEVKRFARAQQMLTLLVKQDPSAANVGYLAVAESGAGELSQAIADFTRSINLGNDTLLVRYGLASTYLRSGEPAPAARELRIVISQYPAYTPARYALGVALVRLARPAEAIEFLVQARRQAPRNAQYWLTLVHARFEAGDSAAATRTADQAMENFPDNRRLALALAQLCLRRAQIREARSLLETAVELQPADAGTKLLLARVSLQVGEPSEALVILKSVPVEAGAHGEVMLLRIEAEALIGHLSSAQADLASARADNPQ
ncbi:MAG: tetratricopeptide repeat protein, partial [Terriglobia bacterium]